VYLCSSDPSDDSGYNTHDRANPGDYREYPLCPDYLFTYCFVLHKGFTFHFVLTLKLSLRVKPSSATLNVDYLL
jgi:hypothetical protein